MFAVAFLAQEVRARAERQKRRTHRAQIVMIVDEAAWIALAIAPDIRTAGILGIGPPIRAFAVVIVGRDRHALGPVLRYAPRPALRGGVRQRAHLLGLPEVRSQRLGFL